MVERLTAVTYTFPTEFDIHHNPNHWANKEYSIRFMAKNNILPHMRATRERLCVPTQTMVMCDVFRRQTTSTLYNMLEENIVHEHIPNGCTDKLLPDLPVNKSAKGYLREIF